MSRFCFFRLLSFASVNRVPIQNSEALLQSEISWLKAHRVRNKVNLRESSNLFSRHRVFFTQEKFLKGNSDKMDEPLLEGHLGVTRELLQLQTPEKKFQVGSAEGGANLITVFFC